MSDSRLVIRDAARELWADRDDEFINGVFAALSADPETIEELDAAMERFNARNGFFFEGFHEGSEDQPRRGELSVFDLAARLVVWESTEGLPPRSGTCAYYNGRKVTNLGIDFNLAEDWLITGTVEGWRELAEKRRRRRKPPLDGRPLHYGEPLLRFIAEATYDAFRELPVPAPKVPTDPAYHREYDLISELHARWMTTPLEGLRNETPREFMRVQYRHIDDDLESRRREWVQRGRCPRGLDPTSAAYRFGGFGSVEIVVYYDLVRELFWQCRDHLADYLREHPADPAREDFVARELGLLEKAREVWLDSPYGGLDSSARTAIHCERARLPEASGVDHHRGNRRSGWPMPRKDSPLEFLMIDSSHLDDAFAFAYWHDTYEDWKEESLAQERWSRWSDLAWELRDRLGVEYPGGAWADPKVAWERSFRTARKPWGTLLAIRQFCLGDWLSDFLAELVQTEPQSPTSSATDHVDRIVDWFHNLKRAVASGQDPEIGQSLAGLGQAIADAADGRPELSEPRSELQQCLRRFLEPPRRTKNRHKGRQRVCRQTHRNRPGQQIH